MSQYHKAILIQNSLGTCNHIVGNSDMQECIYHALGCTYWFT